MAAERLSGEKIVNFVEVGGVGVALAGLLFFAPAVTLGIVIVGTSEIVKGRMRKGKK